MRPAFLVPMRMSFCDDNYSNRSLSRLSDFSSSCRSSSNVVLSFSRSFRASELCQFCIGMILEYIEQLRVGFPT